MLPMGAALMMMADPPQTRLAALVYRIAGGIGWLEPGYFDDVPPPRMQWHTAEGDIQDTANGILLVGPRRILVLDVELAPEFLDTDLKAQMAILNARLEALRTTLAEQRLTLAAELGASG